MATKSPIKLVKNANVSKLLRRDVRSWTCDSSRLAIAELVDRRHKHQRVIIHPSTKKPNAWQASFFEYDVPVRDFQATSCQALLREFPNSHWRLRNVVAKR